MIVKFFFISIILVLAAAMELYDRFSVRESIENAEDEYHDARDGPWEASDLIERAVRTILLLLLL